MVILIGLLLNVEVRSQDFPDTTKIKNNALSIIPQYALIRGIRLDYERRLGNGDLWLLVAPQLYIDNTPTYSYYYYYSNSLYDNYDYMRGAGINVYLKWNAHKSERLDRISGLPSRLFYIAGGPTYQYFEFHRYEEVAVPYEEDGTTYYKFEYQKEKNPIQRFGGVFNMGLQFAMDPFFVDLYLGFGVKISKDKDGETIGLSNSQWLDPTYSGLHFDGGFKFGVYF